ncbi:hypothetical protein C0993_003013 [Termitomyces sp. T159_Od127]|nr:hypothetical protein C0993_003013 [Termitomyces sp. T159_Od127]
MVYIANHPLLERVNISWFRLKLAVSVTAREQLIHAGQVCGFLNHHKILRSPNCNDNAPPLSHDKGSDGRVAHGTDFDPAVFDIEDSAIFTLEVALAVVQRNNLNMQDREDERIYRGLKQAPDLASPGDRSERSGD